MQPCYNHTTNFVPILFYDLVQQLWTFNHVVFYARSEWGRDCALQ